MNSEPPTRRTYEAIGRAVIAAQLLENVIVPIMETHLLVVDPNRYERTNGLLADSNYREPIANILRKLDEKSSIHPDFCARLKEYLDQRHQLIHRWVTHRGLPSERKGDSSLFELAQQVEVEARSIATLLTNYMIRHANPDHVDEATLEFQEKMRRVFLDAHLQPPLSPEEVNSTSTGVLGPAPVGRALIVRA